MVVFGIVLHRDEVLQLSISIWPQVIQNYMNSKLQLSCKVNPDIGINFNHTKMRNLAINWQRKKKIFAIIHVYMYIKRFLGNWSDFLSDVFYD